MGAITFPDVVLANCALWAALGPLLSKEVESRAEPLYFALGLAAATAQGAWSAQLAGAALLGPLKLCAALGAGIVVRLLVGDWLRSLGRASSAGAVGIWAVALGASACAVSTAGAALLLVELLREARLSPDSRKALAVLGCMAASVAGAMSPVGSPLSCAILAQFARAPYPTGPTFLAELLAPWGVPALAALAAGSFLLCAAAEPPAPGEDGLDLWEIGTSLGGSYLAAAGLALLGAAAAPAAERWLLGARPALLYAGSAAAALVGPAWAGLLVGPHLTQAQLRHLLLGAAFASGMLASGAGHNRWVCERLGVGAREWARTGLAAGLALMALFLLSLARSSL